MQDSTKEPMNNCTEEKGCLNQYADLRSPLAGAVGAKVTECNALCTRTSLAQLTSTIKEQVNYEWNTKLYK